MSSDDMEAVHENLYKARIDLRQITERVDEHKPFYEGSIKKVDKVSPTKIGVRLTFLGYQLVKMGEDLIRE